MENDEKILLVLENLSTNVSQINKSLGNLEVAVKETNQRLDKVEHAVKETNQRLSKIEHQQEVDTYSIDLIVALVKEIKWHIRDIDNITKDNTYNIAKLMPKSQLPSIDMIIEERAKAKKHLTEHTL